jgi:hypothetical protein
MRLTIGLVALLVLAAAVGFGGAFAIARAGGDDSDAVVRTTLPSVATSSATHTIRRLGNVAALPALRHRVRKRARTTAPPARTGAPPATTQAPPATTQAPAPAATQAPPARTTKPPPTTTQQPAVTTQVG